MKYYAYRTSDLQWLEPVPSNDQIFWRDSRNFISPLELNKIQALITLYCQHESIVLVPDVSVNEVSLPDISHYKRPNTANFSYEEFEWVRKRFETVNCSQPVIYLVVNEKTIAIIYYRDLQGWYTGDGDYGLTPIDAIFLNKSLAEEVRNLIAKES